MSTEYPLENLLLVLLVASHRVVATVAALDPRSGDETVLAHSEVPCRWQELDQVGRRDAARRAIDRACAKAEVQMGSVVVSVSDPSLAARPADGWVAVGDEVAFSLGDRITAVKRARDQATSLDRETVEVLPVGWTVRARDGERDVEDPVGTIGHHLRLHALRITARRGLIAELRALTEDLGLELEGVVSQPVALYRGIAGRLKRSGSQLVVDCGARHTTFLVRRRDRLVHLETFPFGGDDLTRRMADILDLEEDRAEALKRQIDISVAPTEHGAEGAHQQNLFEEVQSELALQAPAARICRDAVRAFFTERASFLREHGYLGQSGQVHLLGRGALLRGMAPVLREVFGLPVVIGSGASDREASADLDGILVSGLVRAAADLRRETLVGQGTSLRRQASGLWEWLTAPME